jgi:DNA repair photolyase
MIKTNLIQCEKVLAKTGIEIAPYAVNPYRGCEFGCLYCYSQKNKCFKKNNAEWGSFVDIKINCVELLAKELKSIKPERVLIGSTTEVYQQAEEKYCLTRGAIELLNSNNIPMTILTKSALIERDIDVLKNAKVCFTINLHADRLIKKYEKNSPSIGERLKTLQILKENNIQAYVHIGPIFPEIADVGKILEMVYGLTDRVNFESFNYWMCPKENIPKLLPSEEIFLDERKYNEYWQNLKMKIISLNKKFNYKITFFFRPFNKFWASSDEMAQ